MLRAGRLAAGAEGSVVAPVQAKALARACEASEVKRTQDSLNPPPEGSWPVGFCSWSQEDAGLKIPAPHLICEGTEDKASLEVKFRISCCGFQIGMIEEA